MLEQALAMSMNPDSADQPTPSVPDFGSMSEEEQIAYAMQMSLANSGNTSGYHKKKSTHLWTINIEVHSSTSFLKKKVKFPLALVSLNFTASLKKETYNFNLIYFN